MSGSSFLGAEPRNPDFSSAKAVTSDSTFLTINPVFPTSVNLNLTQPLCADWMLDDNRHRDEVAKKKTQFSAMRSLLQRVIEIVSQAIQYY